MNIQRLLVSLAIVAGVWVLPWDQAHASTVLYDQAGFIQGQQSFVQSFDITTKGTVTMTLTDIPWLDTISNLSAFLSTPTGLIGPAMGAGTETMNVNPGMIYAHWSGDANGSYGVGVYGMKISFAPAVPLPASALLLVSGLVMLGVSRLRRRTE